MSGRYVTLNNEYEITLNELKSVYNPTMSYPQRMHYTESAKYQSWERHFTHVLEEHTQINWENDFKQKH